MISFLAVLLVAGTTRASSPRSCGVWDGGKGISWGAGS